MFNWAKQQLANVAGTQEPIYGPSAIKSVAQEAAETPYTELTRDDLKWTVMDSTSVENQIFYFFADNGYIAFAQVIYSNVAGLKINCHFNLKIFGPDETIPNLWCSTPLSNQEFSEDKTSYYADDCAVELNEDGDSFTIKSMNDERAIVNLKITRTAPGFKIGTSGTTLYGTDLANPWGSMRHTFWPRCVSEGTISVKDGPIDFKGRSCFIHALQGMKPHHAAGRWNFVNFQGPTTSSIMMEFTTPASYGTTVVNVGGIAKDGELVYAGATNTAEHTSSKQDPETEWPEPTAVSYTWNGKSKDGKTVSASIAGELGTRVDRVDIMDEVPGFIKTIIASAAGTKPYIYQYHPKLPLKLKVGDEEAVEEGTLYTEATFIVDCDA